MDDITPTDTPDLPTDPAVVDAVVDDRTLMGTMLHYVFGDVDVMVFVVSVMVLVTVLIITTDFMMQGEE